MSNKTLTCKDCNSEFVFTENEQEFYKSKGFDNEPQRCSSCRQARKQQKRSSISFGSNSWGGNRDSGRTFGNRW